MLPEAEYRTVVLDVSRADSQDPRLGERPLT
jgi:hypothetical protein